METKANLNIDKNILDLFWRLCNKNTSTRLQACTDILHSVWKKQKEVQKDNELSKDLQYCIERLVKGLASPRDAARLGYTLLLTEILKKITTVQIEEVLELMKKHLTITGKQDKRDIVFGQLFAYTAIVRSGRLSNHTYLSHVVLSLYDLYHGKNYILNASYKVILDIFSCLSEEKFKESVWSQLKKKLPVGWESCSAESLWILLLSIRLFPNAVSSKYLRNHWGADDMFEADNLVHLKRIIKQTSASFPMLHPLCSEFLLIIKQRKDFNEIWTAVVEDNLFDPDQKDKAFIGFEMIKLALQNAPTKKVVKTVLSTKFRAVFSKSFMNVKHPMNPAATQLAEFLCNFVKDNTVPDIQIIVLKAFLQPPGTVKLDQILKKKEVSLIIQNLLPDAVKSFCDMLKAILLKKKSSSADDDKVVNNMKRFQAVQQIGILVAHPVILTDIEWRMDLIRFLFLHSFFTVTEPNSEIPHCDKLHDPLPDTLREACMNAFFKTVQSLHMRTENQQSPLNNFLQQLIVLTEYAEQLINATDNVDAKFSVEKIQDSWSHLKTIIHKLSKQSKKDGQVNESNAFQALFLQLGFLLFQDPEHISEVLEELYICCKKALKARKQEAGIEDGENEPPWIGVVVDILLSLLSKSSKHLRNLVTYVFPLFCPFIDQNALQQILDVINPQKGDEDMLVDESGDEEQDVDFASGSSSDESEDETSIKPVDDAFKRKIQEALGPAADDSDAESVVLSDSEMFKLDDALAEAFKSQKKSGHTQMGTEDKTMLHFRNRCFDLLMCYLKSEPPLHLVLICVEPLLAAFEFGHHKHQNPLLNKAVSVVHFLTRIKKFQNHTEVNKSELKRLLEMLIPKCHKEINMVIAKKLYSLCIFIVLCFKKLEHGSPSKKKGSKTPFYIKTYLSALDTFASSGSSHMLPQFFTNFMEACPDLAWSFIESFKNVAFSTSTRLFKRTQCLGLLSEALKYSKNQKDVKNEQWLEFGSDVIPLAIESLKSALDASDIKQVYVTELLNIIFTSHSIIEDKTGQALLKKHSDLLPFLTDDNGKINKLNKKGKSWKNRLIICLGGNVNRGRKSNYVKQNESNQEENKSEEVEQSESSPKKRKSEEGDCHESIMNGDVSSKKRKLKHKKKKSVGKIDTTDISNNTDESN